MTITSDNIFESFNNYSADGLLVSDGNGKIVASNNAVSKLTGRAAEEIVGQNITSLLACSCLNDEEKNGNQLLLSTAEDTKLHSGTLICPNGMDLPIPVTHSPIGSADGSAGTLTVLYIIQASSLQQAQTEFVSTVSHELRTPLTSIKGFADTILRAGDRLDAAQQRRYIGIIKDQADRLARLVEDLLAVSRLEARKLQFTIRAIDLTEAVHRVIRNLMEKARSHKLVTKLPNGLPPVWADADRLEQILTNLIDNAIKYSPPDTTVTIEARELTDKPPFLEISINDEGGGIPEEHLSEIFNKFSRLDNPLVRQTEGTGLGLYITKSLVVALGGSISVTSQPKSTTFTVKIPAATLEEQAARGRG